MVFYFFLTAALKNKPGETFWLLGAPYKKRA